MFSLWKPATPATGLRSNAMRGTFNDRMAAGRERAKAYRDSGGGTVQVFATTVAMHRRYGPQDLTALEQFDAESRARWEFAVSQFIEDLRADLYSANWEGFEL
jgi:hypothetical protein